LEGKKEEGKKEEVSVFLELGPEDDIGLAVMQVCERKRLSDVACQVPSPEREREKASERERERERELERERERVCIRIHLI
jgi:hypothetical protein